MQTDDSRSSFFDDDDLTISFDFVKPDKLINKDLLIPMSLSAIFITQAFNSTPEKCFFGLHNRTIVQYQVITNIY